MSTKLEEVLIYTDGGSRGNPGPGAAGFVISDKSGNKLAAKGLFIGKATNNVAEYTAVLEALKCAVNAGVKVVTVYSDSELVVKQINGQYRVKSPQLKPIFTQAKKLLCKFSSWKFVHVLRDKNTEADKLVNMALDIREDVIVTDLLAGQKKQKGDVTKPVRLGVLLSGGGRTLLNILEYINDGRLNAEVAVVISSRSTVAGVERSKKAGLDVKIVRKKDYSDVDDFSGEIEEQLVAAKVDLVIQAGWLCLWKIPENYIDRVMNIHPALLPSFGGQGMWGHHVHESVIKFGCKVSGCTVHFCTNEYDEGPIIVQRCCEVKDGDTSDALADRVFEQECIAYPDAIRLFEQGKIKVCDGRVRISQ
ncbi:phosphoribosylglycinamide formyltransferase [Planctomycetota bacterium]